MRNALLILLICVTIPASAASIADQLLSLNSSKAAIKAALESRGITVGNAPLSDYDDKISQMVVTPSGLIMKYGKCAEAISIGALVIAKDVAGSDLYDVYNHTNPITASFTSDTYFMGYANATGTTNDIIPITVGWYRESGGIAFTYTADQYFTFNSNTITAYNISGGTDLKIPPAINGSVVSFVIPELCYNAGLTSLTLPDDLQVIGYSAFRGNSSLVALDLPASIQTINYAAFKDCSIATDMTLPNSLTTMGNIAFQYNDIASLTFGTGLTSVPNQAFQGNPITSLTLSDNILTIGYAAFHSCSLTDIDLKNVTTVSELAFYNCPINTVTLGAGVSIFNDAAMGSNGSGFSAAYATNGAGTYMYAEGTWQFVL